MNTEIKRSRVGVYAPIVMDDDVLLMHQSSGSFVGQWHLPGGGIEFGEEPILALKRELIEETGYTLVHATLIKVLSNISSIIRAEGEREYIHLIALIKETFIF